jgi:hypothetical protein
MGLPGSAIPDTPREPGIPVQTLGDWHKTRTQPGNENWLLWANVHPRHHALTRASEQAITEFINVRRITTGIRTTRELEKSFCLNVCAAQTDEDRRHNQITASTAFSLVLNMAKAPHTENSPWTPSSLEETYTEYFVGRLDFVPNMYPPELI